MKTRELPGSSIMKSNFDFSNDVLFSPNIKLKPVNAFKVNAELTGDSEIIFKAIIPFNGKLIVTRMGEKNGLPLLSVLVNKGFFINAIPVSLHDETNVLECVLISNKKTLSITIDLIHAEIPF